MKDAPPAEPYPFEADVAQAVVLASCGDPRFHAVIGHAIDPERLSDPAARMLVAGAHAVATKLGQGPRWSSTVVQHLATLMAAGKVTYDQLTACKDYLIEASVNIPAIVTDELCTVVVPIIQRTKHKEAIVAALDGYKNNADAATTAATFDKVAKLGQVVVHSNSSLDDALRRPGFFNPTVGDTLNLGIDEIDQALGGIEHGTLTLLVGSSGSGKSMALSHIAVEAYLAGRHVFFVTLELSMTRQLQRMSRNIVDMTKRETMADPDVALDRFERVAALPTTGRIRMIYAEPQTSPKDIVQQMTLVMRDDPGFEPTVFVTDFADKVRVDRKSSLYDDMGPVIDGLRQIAIDHDGWHITASQSDRKSTNRPWLDLDATADSMNKVRGADVVIGIGRTEEDQAASSIRFSIPKRREGEGAHSRVGPIAWDPERGRIAIVSGRKYPW